MKIVADIDIPFLKGVLEPFADIEYFKGNEITREKISDADALIIRTRTKCTRELLEGSNVRAISTATIGFDHIDVEYCNSNNIFWSNAPGCNSGSVRQYFIAALLYWAKERGVDLNNRTLGIVGVGNVGKKILNFAEIFGMQVVLNDPPRERKEGKCGFISIDGILREADIITLHVPLLFSGPDKTHHLFNRELAEKTNRNTLLINTSRGGVVDQGALSEALSNGILSDFILDVWENEPIIDKSILDKSFLGTPHIAGYSQDGKALGTAMSVQFISKLFDLPLNDWTTDELTPPVNKDIILDVRNKSLQEALEEVVFKIYPIWEDSNLLKENPEVFESIRSDYRIRREFHAYNLSLINDNFSFRKAFQKLGFSVSAI